MLGRHRRRDEAPHDPEADQGWPGAPPPEGEAASTGEPLGAAPAEGDGTSTGEPLGAVAAEGDGTSTGEPLGENPAAEGADEPEGEPPALELYDDAHPELRAPGDEQGGPDDGG